MKDVLKPPAPPPPQLLYAAAPAPPPTHKYLVELIVYVVVTPKVVLVFCEPDTRKLYIVKPLDVGEGIILFELST